MIKTAIVIAALAFGGLSAEAAQRCKAFAGYGDNYGIVATGDSAESVYNACATRFDNCTVTCSQRGALSCKGYFGHTEVNDPVIGDSRSDVAAKCEAKGVNCDIVCGFGRGKSDGDNGGAGGPGDR